MTSRELLRLNGEHEYVVPPLEKTEALGLFRDVLRGLNRTAGERDLPAPGLSPASDRLAAARTKALSANQILERLDQRLALLTAARATPRTARKHSRATIEWSFNLLNEDENASLRGWPFSRAAARWTRRSRLWRPDWTRSSRSSRRVFCDTARSGSGCSRPSVSMRPSDGPGGGRGTPHASARRLLRGHRGRAGRALNGPLERTAREHVAPDTANVVAATEWARTQPDGDLLLRLAVGGEVLRLPPRQQILWLDEALSRPSARPTVLLAHGYRNAGGLYFSAIRDLETAQARLEKSASLYRQLNDPAQESDVLRLLGSVLGDAGDQPAARATLERALALARESGGRPHAILHHLGELELDWGDTERAAELLEGVIEAARREGDSATVAHASHGLGDVLFSRQDWNAAEWLYQESLLLIFELKNSSGCLQCLRALAAAAGEQGQVERAGLLFGGPQRRTSASSATRSAHATSRRTRPLSSKLGTLASNKRWKKARG